MKNKSTGNDEKKDKPKKGKKKIDAAFWVLFAITLILLFIAYLRKGWDLPLAGLVQGGNMFYYVAPNLFMGFALAGVVQVLVPTEYVAKLLGEGSNLKGIFIATVAGVLSPGGPYINIPLVASLYKSGASVGPLAAFLTAWGLIPLSRTLAFEIPLLGAKFAVSRFCASFIFPFIIGAMTSYLFKALK